MPANNRPGWKGLPVTNAPGGLTSLSERRKKSFIILTLGNVRHHLHGGGAPARERGLHQLLCRHQQTQVRSHDVQHNGLICDTNTHNLTALGTIGLFPTLSIMTLSIMWLFTIHRITPLTLSTIPLNKISISATLSMMALSTKG